MAELADAGIAIDFVTLTEAIGARDKRESRGSGMCESVGGVAYITSLTDGLPRVKNIEQYVNIVLDKSKRRQLLLELSSAIERIRGDHGPIAEEIAQTDARLMELGSNTKSDPKHIREILEEADAQLHADMVEAGERKAIGFTTANDSLDDMTGGYHRREVTEIGGETSDGKSVLMRQGIIANACMGVRQLAFSREVSRQRLALDFKAFMSQTNPKHVSDGRKMDMFERERFKDVNKIIGRWPLWIDDSRSLHVDDLVHKARKFIRQNRVEMIWVDYIQLVAGTGANATLQMENVCKGIWDLADGEGVAMVVLSQLNRFPGEKKQRPRLRRSKDSSKIEQDAHTVIFVYQPEDDDGRRIPQKAELVVAKQRHGPTGIIGVKFNTETLIFEER